MRIQNLRNVEAWRAGTGLPPGVHVCTITEAQEATKNGKPQLIVRVQDDQGRSLPDYMVVTNENLGRLKMLLAAAHYPIPDGDFELDPSRLVGSTVVAIVQLEPDPTREGREFPRVKGYKSPQEANSDDIPL